jgi:hypothetical protein
MDWRHPFWPAPGVDRFVVSYPKAGRTWLRVMLAVVEAETAGGRRERVLETWLRDDAPRLAGSSVLFTHALSTSSRESPAAVELFLRYVAGRRRVFLVRDPRDLVVSHFFHLTRRSGRARDVASPGEFVRDPTRGIDRVLRFMEACERSLREDPGPALLLSYEELHRDTERGLRSTLELFEVGADDRAVATAVEFGGFSNLQRLEQEGRLGESSRRLGARDRADPDSRKIRRGEIGSYTDYLSDDDIAYLEERIAESQPPSLGYATPGTPPANVPAGSGASV